jgi:hypothetical protein
MEIHKVAELIRFPAGENASDSLGRIATGELVFTDYERDAGKVAGILTSLEAVKNPRPDADWCFNIVIDQGPNARTLKLNLPPLISVSDSLEDPLFLGADRRLVFFRNRLFMTERPPTSTKECDDVISGVKKAVSEEVESVLSSSISESAVTLHRVQPFEVSKARERSFFSRVFGGSRSTDAVAAVESLIAERGLDNAHRREVIPALWRRSYCRICETLLGRSRDRQL